jgi:hypothetical protein
MHTFAAWAYAIFLAALLAGLIAGVWDYARAWDIKFDKAVAEQNNRKINWAKARKQQVVVPFLGLPLGLIVAGLMVFHFLVSFTWQTYTLIAIMWFLSAPWRRLWQIYTAIRVENHLHRHGYREPEPYRFGALHATRTWYQNGMKRKPRLDAKKSRKVFIGRLRWLNKISWLWLWMRHIRLAVPVLAEAGLSLVWPFTAMFMTFHHSHEAADGVTLYPWWAED